MKKFLKYSLYELAYLFIVFVLAIMFIVTAKADLTKPNNNIKPYEVVKIQLTGLMDNDIPNKKVIQKNRIVEDHMIIDAENLECFDIQKSKLYHFSEIFTFLCDLRYL